MKKLRNIAAIYSTILLLFSLLYFLLLQLPFKIYQNIIFYKGVALLVLTFLIFLVLIIAIIYIKRLLFEHLESFIAAILITFSLHLTLLVIFPVSIDRSLSISLLSYLSDNFNNKSCQGMSKKQLEKKLIQNYVIKNKAVDKRIKEQEIINFIEKKNNSCINITEKGNRYLKYSVII